MKFATCTIALLILLTGISCKKKKYPDDVVITNEAVYYSSMNVNGSRVRLEAGVDDYYMYSSYKQDSNNVYSFVGEIKKINCNTCSNSLKIQINDYKASVFNTPVNADSSLAKGNYQYVGQPKEPSFSVNFSSPAGTSYLWNFGDGTSSNEQNPVHVFSKPGKYNVCLTTQTSKGCGSTLCNVLRLDPKSSLRVSVSVISNTLNTIGFGNTVTGGKAPYTYFWSFGDGHYSTLANPIHSYTYRGGYPVSLMVIDSQQDTARANFNAITQSDPYSCAANYSVTKITPLPNNLNLSHVTVTWRDANGSEYVSSAQDQGADAYFQVVSVSDGGLNENGQSTKKLVIRFKCKVYRGSEVIQLSDAETVLSVAYK